VVVAAVVADVVALVVAVVFVIVACSTVLRHGVPDGTLFVFLGVAVAGTGEHRKQQEWRGNVSFCQVQSSPTGVFAPVSTAGIGGNPAVAAADAAAPVAAAPVAARQQHVVPRLPPARPAPAAPAVPAGPADRDTRSSWITAPVNLAVVESPLATAAPSAAAVPSAVVPSAAAPAAAGPAEAVPSAAPAKAVPSAAAPAATRPGEGGSVCGPG
jgi:hypothetical protein